MATPANGSGSARRPARRATSASSNVTPHEAIATTTNAQQNDALEQNQLNAKSDVLAQAKDRGQMVATGAMSVVQIAVLKDLLALGPTRVKFYELMYGLIVASLVLQILAGVLAIMVTHVRTYFTKYKDDLLEDLCENCLCIRVGCDNGEDHIDQDDYLLAVDAMDDGENKHNRLHPIRQLDAKKTIRKKPTACCGGICCGCYVTNRVLEPYEYEVLDKYYAHQAGLTELELRGVEAEVEIKFLKTITEVTKADIERLEKEKETYSLEEFKEKAGELQKKLQDALDSKSDYEDSRMHLDVAEARGRVLAVKAENIRRNRILKVATFWQNIINLIFYTVFVINICITGLGISEISAIEKASDAPPLKAEV